MGKIKIMHCNCIGKKAHLVQEARDVVNIVVDYDPSFFDIIVLFHFGTGK